MHGTLSLDVLHPGEVPHVLSLAAEIYRQAGERERDTPAASGVWYGLALVMQRAAELAQAHLRDTGMEIYREG